MTKEELEALFNKLNGGVSTMRARYDEQLTTFDSRLRDVENANARFALSSGGPATPRVRPEARAAFMNFLRTGDASVMAPFAPKNAMSTQSGPDGGFLIPEEIGDTIDRLQRNLSVMRQIARIRTVTTDSPKQLVNVNGVDSGWVGETQDRPDTNNDSFDIVAPYMGELYASPKLSQRELDDNAYNADEVLQTSVAEEFAVQEGAGFVGGNGILKPKGFTTYPTASTGDSVRPFGTLQYVKTGNGTGFASTNGGDCLINVVQALRAVYRAGALWIMNSATVAVVRQLKDGMGNYLWRPGAENGRPDQLLGYPIFEDENMPDIGANAFPIAFGNFMRGYLICDHVTGTRMLRDPFTAKPWVKFYTTKRVGGGLVNSQAIKLLKVSA